MGIAAPSSNLGVLGSLVEKWMVRAFTENPISSHRSEKICLVSVPSPLLYSYSLTPEPKLYSQISISTLTEKNKTKQKLRSQGGTGNCGLVVK